MSGKTTFEVSIDSRVTSHLSTIQRLLHRRRSTVFSDTNTGDLFFVHHLLVRTNSFSSVEIRDSNERKRTRANDNRQSTRRKTLLGIGQPSNQLLKIIYLTPTATTIAYSSHFHTFYFTIIFVFAKKKCHNKRLRKISSAARGLRYFSNVRGPAAFKMAVRPRSRPQSGAARTRLCCYAFLLNQQIAAYVSRNIVIKILHIILLLLDEVIAS